MKKSSLLLASVISIPATLSANAYDFNDKIYGKANFKIGYSLEKVRGDVLEENKFNREMEDWGFESNHNKDFLHNFDFSLGYDVYFKATNLIHPFVGAEITARAPLKIKTRDTTKQPNYFSVDLKIGSKFNHIVKNVSLQSYFAFGYALMARKNDNFFGLGYTETEKVNALNYGCGLDLIYDFNDKLGFIGGFEYKRVKALEKTKETQFKLETDQFEFKFGVQFL